VREQQPVARKGVEDRAGQLVQAPLVGVLDASHAVLEDGQRQVSLEEQRDGDRLRVGLFDVRGQRIAAGQPDRHVLSRIEAHGRSV
jgi:hypothetical protein